MTTRTRSAAVRQKVRAVDPLTPLVGLVALIVYPLHGFGGFLNRDLGVYAYGGQQFADGVAPYEGILNRAGPLAQILPGIGIAAGRLVGIDDVLGARLLYMLFSVAAVCAAYLAGRDVFISRCAGLASAAGLLGFLGFIEYATNGPREKTPMVLFLLLAIWMLSRRRFLGVGIFIGLATLCWQPVFLVGAAAAVILALTMPGRRIRSLIEIAGGGLIPTALVALYFGVFSALNTFYLGFFEINAKYAGTTPFSARPGHIWRELREGYGLSLWAILLGLASFLLVCVAAAAWRRRRAQPESLVLAALGAGTVVGLVWTWRDINGWPDMFVLLPSAALGLGALVKELSRLVSGRTLLIATAGWAALATVFALTYSIGNRNEMLAFEQRSVDAVFDNLPDDATMLSIEAPQAMVQAGRTNPTRNQMMSAALVRHLNASWPGGRYGFASWVIGQEPTIIAIHGEYNWLTPQIMENYSRVGVGPGWTWYMSNDESKDSIRQVRHAVKAVRARG